MQTMTVSKARLEMKDLVNRVLYTKERVYLSSYGKIIAVIVPIEDMQKLEELEKKILIIK